MLTLFSLKLLYVKEVVMILWFGIHEVTNYASISNPICPNWDAIYQYSKNKWDTYCNNGICISSPRIVTFSHCIKLSSKSRDSTQTPQQTKLSSSYHSVTIPGVHLHQINKYCLWQTIIMHILLVFIDIGIWRQIIKGKRKKTI